MQAGEPASAWRSFAEPGGSIAAAPGGPRQMAGAGTAAAPDGPQPGLHPPRQCCKLLKSGDETGALAPLLMPAKTGNPSEQPRESLKGAKTMPL